MRGVWEDSGAHKPSSKLQTVLSDFPLEEESIAADGDGPSFVLSVEKWEILYIVSGSLLLTGSGLVL